VNFIEKLFPRKKENEEGNFNDILKTVSASLFLMIAKADDEYSSIEKEAIKEILKNNFNLNKSELDQLITTAEENLSDSIGVYEFTSKLNEYLSYDQKYEVLKNIWQIILADSKVDSYEDNLIRKIHGALNLDQKDFVRAKMEIKGRK